MNAVGVKFYIVVDKVNTNIRFNLEKNNVIGPISHMLSFYFYLSLLSTAHPLSMMHLSRPKVPEKSFEESLPYMDNMDMTALGSYGLGIKSYSQCLAQWTVEERCPIGIH